jgi:hypothetical protein
MTCNSTAREKRMVAVKTQKRSLALRLTFHCHNESDVQALRPHWIPEIAKKTLAKLTQPTLW